MTTYTITNALSGVTFGPYEAETEAEALDLWAQDAGYTDYAEVLRDVGPVRDGEIVVTADA